MKFLGADTIVHSTRLVAGCIKRSPTCLCVNQFNNVGQRNINFNPRRNFNWTASLYSDSHERKTVCPDTVVCNPETGMNMPALILGTWKTDKADVAEKVLTTALQIGYRAIDTSTHYGNEKVLGVALEKALCAAKLKREDVFIITKLPWDSMRFEKINECVCKSLESLKTTYIDLYMINFPAGSCKDLKGKHVPDPKVDHKSIWKRMEELVGSGKAKSIGVCNFNSKQLEELTNFSALKPSNIQVEISAYFQQADFRNFARDLGVTVTGYAPLGISDTMAKWLKKQGAKDSCKPNPLCDPSIECIGKKYCKTPGQVIIRYLLQMDDMMGLVVGTAEPEILCQNFGIFDFQLDQDDMCKLKALEKGKRYFDRSVFQYLFPGVGEHPLFPWLDC